MRSADLLADRERMAGVTLVEVLLAAAGGALLLASIMLLASRLLVPGRSALERGQTVAGGRVAMERVLDTLRKAANDAVSDQYWLQAAADDDITIWGDADNDRVLELVRYRLVGDELRQQVGAGGERTVARGMLNAVQGVPLFAYYSLGGAQALPIDPARLGDPAVRQAVGRVLVQVVLDAGPGTPGPLSLRTMVTPRRGELRCQSGC